jgi:transcriptional regulator with XRE-family HTH domain
MSYGTVLRTRREQKGWTQRQLAEAIGCTDGYLAHLENEIKLPSLDISMALTQALRFSDDEQQQFLETVEVARRQRAERRIRTRGAVVRGALRTRGSVRRTGLEPEADEPDAERIASDLATDPDLRLAYQHLKTALANPRLRETVLNALRALARESERV